MIKPLLPWLLLLISSCAIGVNNFSSIDICDDLRPYLYWPLASVEFDEFRYDADVREGLKNKEKLINPVFQLTYDNKELRSLRSEKGVGFFSSQCSQ